MAEGPVVRVSVLYSPAPREVLEWEVVLSPGATVLQALQNDPAVRYRRWVRESFKALAAETGVTEPAALADALILLYDGALATAEAAKTARAAAMTAKRVARLTIPVAKAASPA